MQIALHVRSADDYVSYRRAIAPVLERYGGAVVHDFLISEVLRTTLTHPVTRTTTIRFPDDEARRAFVEDSVYHAARDRYFTAAVEDSTVLAIYSSG